MINDVSKMPENLAATAAAINDSKLQRHNGNNDVVGEQQREEERSQNVNMVGEWREQERPSGLPRTDNAGADTTHANGNICKQQQTSGNEVLTTTTTTTISRPSASNNSTSGCCCCGHREPQQHKLNSVVAGQGEQTVKPSSSSSLPSSSSSLSPSLPIVAEVLQNQTATLLTHKTITKPASEASYQRTLETETSPINCRNAHQCELLESNLARQPIVVSSIQDKPEVIQHAEEILRIPSLAERKALLKQEFFKDFSQLDYQPKTSTLSKRLLKKQHNLKLKIPQKKSADTEPKSLVELRKLDLQAKKSLKCSSNPHLAEDAAKVFPSVKELAKRFDMIVPQTKVASDMDMVSLKPEVLDQRSSPLSDEGCNLGQSPYSSDDDNESIRTTHTAIERVPKRKDKVARSASSDSALGLDVDESLMDTSEATPPSGQQQQKRRMTLTVTDLPLRPALLPLAEPTTLPDSPPVDMLANFSLNQTQIPTKVLLEERVVEIPEDPRSGGSSRRESSQSCISDFPPADMQGVRFVRTPSVVVSDYSDDIMCGITLEEIEYFRAQRMRRRSSLDTAGTEKDALDNNSDVSAASSCSNLYYCGSTISALDGAECLVNGMRLQLERKTSDCSTCSASGDEDNACGIHSSSSLTIPEQPEDCQDLSDLLANQHLSCKRSKKVGSTATGFLSVDNTPLP
uniref:Uncharacterized protein n=1 Tax=Musca domestica TaxID=7370 RepID=A0A1I8N8G9_MUSDO